MNDEEMTLISLDLSDRLLAFLAVYANENDMKIEEAMNAIFVRLYSKSWRYKECLESKIIESLRDDENLEARSVRLVNSLAFNNPVRRDKFEVWTPDKVMGFSLALSSSG